MDTDPVGPDQALSSVMARVLLLVALAVVASVPEEVYAAFEIEKFVNAIFPSGLNSPNETLGGLNQYWTSLGFSPTDFRAQVYLSNGLVIRNLSQNVQVSPSQL